MPLDHPRLPARLAAARRAYYYPQKKGVSRLTSNNLGQVRYSPSGRCAAPHSGGALSYAPACQSLASAGGEVAEDLRFGARRGGFLSFNRGFLDHEDGGSAAVAME